MVTKLEMALIPEIDDCDAPFVDDDDAPVIVVAVSYTHLTLPTILLV